jgi:two-component system OmpR family sensor kinase
VRSLRLKLLSGSLLTIGLPLVLFAVVAATVLWRFYLRELEADLDARARVIGDAIAPALAEINRQPAGAERSLDSRELIQQVIQWSQHARSRVTIADVRGIVRASSSSQGIGLPVDDASRPGLRDAVRGRGNVTVWKSPNFDFEDTMYVNVPVRHEGRLVGAVRVAHSLQEIQQRVARVRASLLAAVLVYAALLGLLTWILARGIVRPIEALQRDALQVAGGKLSYRVRVQGEDEIAHLARTINQMTARLEVLEDLRRRFVSDASHELRTPLTAIRSMAETILRYGDSDPGLSERYLPRIVAQTDHLARLATQLLDLALIESGRFSDARASLSLVEVLDEVALSYGSRAAELGVEFVVAVPARLPLVHGDRDHLLQVFVNLLDNAFRHTPAGGKVTLSAGSTGERVVASVGDTGRGIPSAHLPHLFERFYRVEPSRSTRSGGAGLGLAIVREIVVAHDGHIEVSSAVGEGTRFDITLPRLATDGRSSHAPPSPTTETDA